MLRRCIPMALALALGACSLQPERADGPAQQFWQQRQAELINLRSWQIRGKAAMSGAHEAWQADLRWRQQQERYAIRLMAPLSQGTLALEGGPAGVWVRSSGAEEPLFTSDPAALLRRETGWSVPLELLRFWVVGLPAPQLAHDHELDAHGRLKTLSQAGWRVTYRRYREVAGMQLPDKIFMRKDDWDVRLLVREWEV